MKNNQKKKVTVLELSRLFPENCVEKCFGGGEQRLLKGYDWVTVDPEGKLPKKPTIVRHFFSAKYKAILHPRFWGRSD